MTVVKLLWFYETNLNLIVSEMYGYDWLVLLYSCELRIIFSSDWGWINYQPNFNEKQWAIITLQQIYTQVSSYQLSCTYPHIYVSYSNSLFDHYALMYYIFCQASLMYYIAILFSLILFLTTNSVGFQKVIVYRIIFKIMNIKLDNWKEELSSHSMSIILR